MRLTINGWDPPANESRDTSNHHTYRSYRSSDCAQTVRLPDFSKKLPCGCQARKEIIFTRGNLGVPEAAILVTVSLALLLAFRKGKVIA
jgi:hypothetical protein